MRSLALLFALSLPASAGSLPVDSGWAAGTNWSHHQNYMGFPSAWLYVPDSFTPRAPEHRGLVVHLVGCGQMPYQAAQASGWADAAEAFGLVVLVPGPIAPAHPNRDAPNVECFNYGYDGAYGVYQPTRNDRDPAALIGATEALLDDADLAIDPAQVYVAGLSAGGAMAVELGCMAPDLFAGVITSAAPGMGTPQGSAVMPPPAGYGAASMEQICRRYAQGSGDAGALSTQVHVVVSDDNGLPAGAGPLDVSKFNDQTIWDGDKFCPHIYSDIRTEAFGSIMGLGAPTGEVVIAEGEGIGCAGGEASRGDGGEVRCVINDQIRRAWQAHATLWQDGAGRTRLVKIEQDTLRHGWPSGPVELGTVQATPTRATLRADGFIDEGTGEFDRSRMGSAPNGTYGAIYFNQEAFDLPMYAAALMSDNNPRLGEAVEPGDPVDPGPDAPAPPPDDFELSAGAPSVAGDCVELSGAVQAADEVQVYLFGVGATPATLVEGAWSWSRCGLPAGEHRVIAAAFAEGVALGTAAPQQLRVEPAAEGGAVEEVSADLYVHVATGRVVRFTPEWSDYRDRYCLLVGFTYVCEAFSLYRCEGEQAWSETQPDCGGEAAPAASAALAATGVAEGVALSLEVSNTGPDVAAQAWAVAQLPGLEVAGGECLRWRDWLLCALGEVDTEAPTTLALALTGVGAHSLDFTIGAPASPALSLSVEVELAPAPVPPPPETPREPPMDPPGAEAPVGDALDPQRLDPETRPEAPGAPGQRRVEIERTGEGCQSAPAPAGWAGLVLMVGLLRRRLTRRG